MKKLLALFFLFILSIGAAFALSRIIPSKTVEPKPKTPILKVALITDSHNNNDLLAKVLSQAKAANVDFVIGLGDYTNTGTMEELGVAKNTFDASGLTYYVTAGDHDLWDSRNRSLESRDQSLEATAGEALDNFRQVFGQTQHVFREKGIQFVIVDNSDIYTGISQKNWEILNSKLETRNSKLTYVFAHKTPYHPQSGHIMGEETSAVAEQAKEFMDLMEKGKVDGFFSGDLHFFAKFNSADGSVRMTTIGAVTREPNPQGPRFGVLTIYEDYSWEVADVEIRSGI